MVVILYLDTILVPFSLFITTGYHAYLWYHFKKKLSLTTFGMQTIKRRLWLQDMKQGDDKKGMLAVQGLRNTLMTTILIATITIIITLSLAALINNTYSAKHLFNNPFFGLQSDKILLLKYGSASIFLVTSFLCSSMALGTLINANYLIYALGFESSSSLSLSSSSPPGYARKILETGFVLALVGNRALCIAFPMLLWMIGPVAVALSLVALVWELYILDFGGTFTTKAKQENFL